MAVTSKEEILNRIKEKFGDASDDETLSLYEDITDTLDSFSTSTSAAEDWEKKYKENDEAWRKKYRDRFFNTPADESDPEPDPQDITNIGEIPEKKMTYEDLFKESE